MPTLKIRPELINAAVDDAAPVKLKAVPAHDGLNPELIAALGGAADAASTFRFLKKGSGSENNAMLQGMGPAGTALGVAGMSAGMAGLRALVRKKFPKLADALAVNQGARQMGLAANNLQPPGPGGASSDEQYDNTMARSASTHPLPQIPLIPRTKIRLK